MCANAVVKTVLLNAVCNADEIEDCSCQGEYPVVSTPIKRDPLLYNNASL